MTADTFAGIYVLKIGGRQLDDADFLREMVDVIHNLRQDHSVVLVHGGGRAIQWWQQRLGLTPEYIEGLRVTDEDSLEVAEAVLSGLINKYLVALFLNAGIRAVGISGVDAGLVRVTRMHHPKGDLGRVGDIQEVDLTLVETLLASDMMPIISPISLGQDGLTYNVNADHVARAVAGALRAERLYFISDVPGVLIAGQTVRVMTAHQAESWIAEGFIRGGMIPKVRSALEALRAGVHQVIITNLSGLRQNRGTAIVPDTSHHPE